MTAAASTHLVIADDHPLFRDALQRLFADASLDTSRYPLRLHSLRESLTHNSWMHNADSLARTGRLDKLGVTAADALKELARCLKAH